MIDLHIGADAEVAGSLMAAWVAERIDDAIGQRGRAVVALSGGSTPVAALTELGRKPLAWERIHIVQVDERIVPDGSPDRNAGAIAAALPLARFHPMPVGDDPAIACADYAATLGDLAGHPPVVDVVHLGLGSDGHTASWPPGREPPAADVAYVERFNGHDRLTLGLPLVNRARSIVWLVTGAAKAPILQRLLEGDETIPANRVRTDGLVIAIAGAPAATPPLLHHPQ